MVASSFEAAQPFSLAMNLSAGLAKLSPDAEDGRDILEVEFTLNKIGDGSSCT